MGISAEQSGSASDVPPEQWYLRIDDKEFGPVTRSQMEYFLRPPRLCSLIQIMCTVEYGVWHSIIRDETIEQVLSRFGIEDKPLRGNGESTFLERPESLLKLFSDRPRIVWQAVVARIVRYYVESTAVLLFVFVVVVLNSSFILVTSDGLDRQRQIFKQFESIWADIRSIDPEVGSSDEWREIADNATEEVNALLEELISSQDTSEIRQRLLFAGREQLLPILKCAVASVTDSKQSLLFEEEMKRLRDLLAEKSNW